MNSGFNSDFDDDWIDDDFLDDVCPGGIVDELSFKKGQADARAGLGIDDNPFDYGTAEALSWHQGFLDGGL